MAKHAVIELAVVHAGDIGRFLGRVLMRFVHMLVFRVHMLMIRMGVVMLFVRRGLSFLFSAVSLIPALRRLGVMRVLGVGRLDRGVDRHLAGFFEDQRKLEAPADGVHLRHIVQADMGTAGLERHRGARRNDDSVRHDNPRGVGVNDDLADLRGPRADQLVGRVALVFDDHEQRRVGLAIARRAQPGMLDGDIARLIFVGSDRRASRDRHDNAAGRGTQKGMQQVASINGHRCLRWCFPLRRHIRWRAREVEPACFPTAPQRQVSRFILDAADWAGGA